MKRISYELYYCKDKLIYAIENGMFNLASVLMTEIDYLRRRLGEGT